MIAIQIGIIIFLIFILAIIYQDEYRKRKLSRKSAKLSRFWKTEHNRRKTFRINTEIEVLYEVISGARILTRQISMSKNISLGGMNLALNEKLLPGIMLKLQLNVPEGSRPIFAQGKVVWVKEISEKFTEQKEEKSFATGIQFIRMNPHNESVLRNFINQRIENVPEHAGL